MKKIFLITLVGLILSAVPAYAVVKGNLVQRETEVASKAAIVTQAQANQMQNLQQRAQEEVTRRLKFLNGYLTGINKIQKLTTADKTGLQTEIQAQINELSTLQTKITADTDITTLRTDVKSIISNYYVFAFFRVKINLLIAAGRLSTITDNLNTIYTKLQTRINEAQAAGTDATTLNALLLDMNTQIINAKTEYQMIEAELLPLNAQGYPGNKSTLTDARAKLNTATVDLKAAYEDAIQIRQQLGDLKIKNPQVSTNSAH
jgi:hypothetical protein